MRSLLLALVVVLLGAPTLRAQPVSVQQPAVGVTGVGTAVSVPDRGSAYLGGVNSAAAGRAVFGLPRTSSSLGLQMQGSSISTHVFIHDLRAMDEALLATAPNLSSVDQWSQQLAERRSASPAARVVDAPTASRAAEFETRALKAEQAGKRGVALTYWRLAARDGSAIAAERVAALMVQR